MSEERPGRKTTDKKSGFSQSLVLKTKAPDRALMALGGKGIILRASGLMLAKPACIRPASKNPAVQITTLLRFALAASIPLYSIPLENTLWVLSNGAGDGNRTHIIGLGSRRSATELHPRWILSKYNRYRAACQYQNQIKTAHIHLFDIHFSGLMLCPMLYLMCSERSLKRSVCMVSLSLMRSSSLLSRRIMRLSASIDSAA